MYPFCFGCMHAIGWIGDRLHDRSGGLMVNGFIPRIEGGCMSWWSVYCLFSKTIDYHHIH